MAKNILSLDKVLSLSDVIREYDGEPFVSWEEAAGWFSTKAGFPVVVANVKSVAAACGKDPKALVRSSTKGGLQPAFHKIAAVEKAVEELYELANEYDKRIDGLVRRVTELERLIK